MCPLFCIDSVDRTRPYLTRIRSAFGGTLALLSRDIRQILRVNEGRSRTQITHVCIMTSPLYCKFWTCRVTENMPPKVLKNHPSAHADALSIAIFHLALGGGQLSTDVFDCVTLPPSTALESNVHLFCRAILNCIVTYHMEIEWLTKYAIFALK